MSGPSTLQNYPLPSSSSLAAQFVGKTLNELPTPAVVLDRALIKRNCNAMLNVCKELGVGFRAHVKSHKTAELSKLQVGEQGAANFIVSTIIEAEHLAEVVLEEQGKGRDASVCLFLSLLYSIFCFLWGVVHSIKAVLGYGMMGLSQDPAFTLHSSLLDHRGKESFH